MREYDAETLAKVQATELEILKDFIDICDRHNLQYFGIAGTGIGTLRHEGFIPWDDDIDVAMPRKDFNRFVKYVEKEMPDKYLVLNFEHDENYPLMTTRLVLKGTKFIEYALKDLDCPFGIFLDLYPFDSIPDDPKKFKRQCIQSFFWSKMLILRSVPHPVLGFKGWKAKVVQVICAAVHHLMAFFNVPKKWLYKMCYRASTQYNYMKDTERIDFLCDTTPYMNIYKRSDVFPLVKRPFNGIMMNFPNDMHENLTGMYGDYMQLPPEDKRKNHFPYQLQLPGEEVLCAEEE